MDRLTSLPDDTRVHILSFLTTKEGALTSLLSKKWRNLFARVPNLVLDDSVFVHPEKGKRERDGILDIFMAFVDRVLALQGACSINKFSLKCETGVCPDAVNRWICNVLNRGVSELDLCLGFKEEYRLPRELFVSKTLVELRYKSESGFYWWVGTEAVSLPMLKTLNIGSEMIYCDFKIEALLPCLPVLEECRMGRIVWKDSDGTVSSATVKKLCINAAGMSFQNPRSISFDTPNLFSFNYSDFLAEDYPLVNMKNVVAAQIALFVTPEQINRVRTPNNELLGYDGVRHFGNVVKLMSGIKNVQELHLHSDTLEVLSLCCDTMPVFNNLKRLLIKSEEDRGWQAMPVILRNCPHLEYIMIEGLVHHVTDKCGDACDCVYRKEKGRSLRSCLVKMIVIKRFRGTMKEMNMIEHFLDYFPCLKMMRVFIEENTDTELNNAQACALVKERFEEFNEMYYSCNVKLLMTDYLCKKWKAEGQGSLVSSLLTSKAALVWIG